MSSIEENLVGLLSLLGETETKLLEGDNYLSEHGLDKENPIYILQRKLLQALELQSLLDTSNTVTSKNLSHLSVQMIKEVTDIDHILYLHRENLKYLYMYSKNIPVTDEGEFLIEEYLSGNFEYFFERYFTKYEGSSFSSDKVEYLVHCIEEHLKTNKEINWGNVSKEQGKYWLPKSFTTLEEAIEKYKKWKNNI